jgi:hypothetical protein
VKELARGRRAGWPANLQRKDVGGRHDLLVTHDRRQELAHGDTLAVANASRGSKDQYSHTGRTS